ncbi:RNA polymerase sigma-70 factor (ECF subfamily) [Hephaestia caeni]|uniref:RNA polymerase sigma-70 factor (ECF subfamily) n=1 Tax=Hephaestia caeni TaxID=645617 RepID=A0A397PE97_9SPHN|nr:RNA polymerase sigma factor [Hephaestia caeni]RIA46249.1 RNA polymerase sigma-70 factor (ECF subfamily) [Hephaestia caeni]
MDGAHQGDGTLAAPHPDSVAASSSPQRLSLEILYRAHFRDLARYIGRRFGSGPPEPEEVAQAAFTRLAAADNFASLDDPRGYLYSIACNLVIDHQRRQGHRNAIHRDLSYLDEYLLSESSPERVLLAKERFAIFEEALRAMPKMRRRIFLLVRAEGHAPRDVARQFGMSDAAIYKHVQRALEDCAYAFEKAERRG